VVSLLKDFCTGTSDPFFTVRVHSCPWR